MKYNHPSLPNIIKIRDLYETSLAYHITPIKSQSVYFGNGQTGAIDLLIIWKKTLEKEIKYLTKIQSNTQYIPKEKFDINI